ncbi:MAG: cation transporter [Desulfurococcaceae archaeon]
MNKDSVFQIILVLGLAGGIVKITGSLIYSSQALFIDSLTCFSNIVALLATSYFIGKSYLPRDEDHPFGHYRLGYGGGLVTIVAYGFVAGVATAKLALTYGIEYSVGFRAIYYAVAGFVLYAIVVALSLIKGGFYRAYGFFTISELFESGASIIAVLIGYLFNYIYDYIVGVILSAYIFYELFINSRELLNYLTDTSAPENVVRDVINDFEESGFEVVDIRLRRVSYDRYHGDIKVRVRNVGNVYDKISDIKKHLEKIHNVDLAVELEESSV